MDNMFPLFYGVIVHNVLPNHAMSNGRYVNPFEVWMDSVCRNAGLQEHRVATLLFRVENVELYISFAVVKYLKDQHTYGSN
jgi:hypothetical protein